MIKVSVIIPVYNCEKYLSQCLDSVLSQTLEGIEVICVDDGSTDNSLNILKKYAQNDKRIKIITQKNQHAGIARNNGLNIAQGEYIHFLDADDWVTGNIYSELYKIATEQNIDIIKFKTYSYNNETNRVEQNSYTDIKGIDNKYFERILTTKNNINEIFKLPDSPWSGFYRHKFLKDNNIYFDNLVCANDVGFFYRCIVKKPKVYLSSMQLLYYRENNKNSLVGIRPANFQCQIELYKITNEITKNSSKEIKYIVANKVICSIFNRYLSYRKNKNIPPNIKFQIHQKIKCFLPEVNFWALKFGGKKKYIKTKIKLQFDEIKGALKKTKNFFMEVINA